MIREARAGRRVVRLKGGDPFIFGRGGEDARPFLGHGQIGDDLLLSPQRFLALLVVPAGAGTANALNSCRVEAPR